MTSAADSFLSAKSTGHGRDVAVIDVNARLWRWRLTSLVPKWRNGIFAATSENDSKECPFTIQEPSVRPDVRIKISPIFSKSYPKIHTAVCTLKVLFSNCLINPQTFVRNFDTKSFQNSPNLVPLWTMTVRKLVWTDRNVWLFFLTFL